MILPIILKRIEPIKLLNSIDGGVKKFFFNNITGIINQNLWESLSPDNITIRFWANDTKGNIACY